MLWDRRELAGAGVSTYLNKHGVGAPNVATEPYYLTDWAVRPWSGTSCGLGGWEHVGVAASTMNVVVSAPVPKLLGSMAGLK